MIFIYVCLEVADCSMMFTCWDSVMCAMCMQGMGVGLLWVVPLFASWSMTLLLVIPMCALIFLYCYVMFGP